MKLPLKIALIGLVLGLLFDWLFYETDRIGLNLLIAEALFIGASYLVAKLGEHRLPHRAHIAAGFALAYAGTFAIWTSSYGLTVSGFGFLIANLLFVIFAIGHEAHFYHPLDVFFTGTFDLGMRLMSRLNIISHLKPEKVTLRQSSIFRGVIFSVPILLIFIGIFASADAVFASYIQDFWQWLGTFTDLPRLIQHLIIVGFFTVLFTLFFAAAFWQRFVIELRHEIVPRFLTESKVMLSGLVTLFALFLIVQASTLFGGETALRALDITYSSYARSGFNQLIIAAVLVTGIILTLRAVHGFKADKKLMGLHLVLLGETFLVLISAYTRMFLYIGAYGYTPARIFSLAVMDTMTILLLMLAYNVAKNQSQVIVMRQGLVVLGACALLFTMSSPDAASVALNIRRAAESDNLIDVYQFDDLSEEADSRIIIAHSMPEKIFGLIATKNPVRTIIDSGSGSYEKGDAKCQEIIALSEQDGFIQSMRDDAYVRRIVQLWYEDRDAFQMDDWRTWNYSRSLSQFITSNDIPVWATEGLSIDAVLKNCK